MARFEIKDGPDKFTLVSALSVRTYNRPYPVSFTLVVFGGRDRKVEFHITNLGINDESGHKWLISAQSADFSRYYAGYYRTDRREGYIVEVDEEKSRETTVRNRIEGAMSYGEKVKVTFSNTTRNSPFRGQTVTFTNIRPCHHHPLTRFFATPPDGLLDPRALNAAEAVGIFIDSVESVEIEVMRP